MTVDSGNFGPDIRSAVRRHWVLLLIPGVIMMVLGLLAAASPLVSTLVVDTASGWMFLTAGFVGLAALFTTRNVPGLIWTSRRRGIGDPNRGLPCLAAAGGLGEPDPGAGFLLRYARARADRDGVQASNAAPTVMALDAVERHCRRNACCDHHRGLAGDCRLGPRSDRWHQSVPVRPRAGDDRDCVPQRRSRSRADGTVRSRSLISSKK